MNMTLVKKEKANVKKCNSCGNPDNIQNSILFGEILCFDCLVMATNILNAPINEFENENARARTTPNEQYEAYLETFPMNDPRD